MLKRILSKLSVIGKLINAKIKKNFGWLNKFSGVYME
jgi:hypothetical protein